MADHTCDGSGCPLGRREFLGAAALTALSLLQTACGDGQIGPTQADDTGSTGTTLVVTVSSFTALANVGGAARVDGGNGLPVALVRTGATSFAAFSLRCPHEGVTVSVQTNGFYCTGHGARFASSGMWTGGQRTTNLRGLVSTYDAVAGTVTINR
ncbi:MAG: Rieske 2Fe-2S domain-containing protein [Gemmatimonadetes bacterium]|nr:Rieske 2Fe-2S domain-containing protein [Gemmatimonadota bacterium]